MDILKRLNDAVRYIEEHLDDDIDIDKVSRKAFFSPEGFKRFFSQMTPMTLSGYIRCRRMTLAAYDLRDTSDKLIDIAVKYGYTSADSFAKAFIRQHGTTPALVRAQDMPLKICPPVNFSISVKGAVKMDFRIVSTGDMILWGLSKKFTGDAEDRFPQEHIMWADDHDDIQNKVCSKIPGIWYGIWDRGFYWIARPEDGISAAGLEKVVIPGGRYAAFTTGFGGFAGDELPKLRDEIFGSWIKDMGYTIKRGYEVEVYHLYPRSEKDKRYYELWIPVE